MNPQQTIAHHRITAKHRGCGHRCDLSGSSDPVPAASPSRPIIFGQPGNCAVSANGKKTRISKSGPKWHCTTTPLVLSRCAAGSSSVAFGDAEE